MGSACRRYTALMRLSDFAADNTSAQVAATLSQRLFEYRSNAALREINRARSLRWCCACPLKPLYAILLAHRL